MFTGGMQLCFVSGGVLEGTPGLYVDTTPTDPAAFVREVDSIAGLLAPIRRSRLIWFDNTVDRMTELLVALRSLKYFTAITTDGSQIPHDLQLYNLVRVRLTSEEWMMHGCHELQADLSDGEFYPKIPNGNNPTLLVTVPAIHTYMDFTKKMPGMWRLCRRTHRVITLVEAAEQGALNEDTSNGSDIGGSDPALNSTDDPYATPPPEEAAGRTPVDKK